MAQGLIGFGVCFLKKKRVDPLALMVVNRRRQTASAREVLTNFWRALTAWTYAGQAAIVASYEEPHEECAVCLEHPRSCALIPCGHVFCSKCAALMVDCPVCRCRRDATLQLYL